MQRLVGLGQKKRKKKRKSIGWLGWTFFLSVEMNWKLKKVPLKKKKVTKSK